ncbi:hypothetical protein LTS16_012518 [Friedmanniomyces endolithicus]|nr:hypothetical protein LTS01_008695 [Friedmanniomyces endolithicus]KAK1037900.1 hypothetical protein LTS16_012518 [Friedmanniomyces endolithicus]KAK1081326.1 hypothetical protein LTR33_004786 [Friedmanniomyces endolithicus]
MFSTKMSDWFRNILSCCDRQDEEEERPALQISGPTNFRREEIKLPGLDPEQQRWIREKAIADAGRMYEHLSPLRSSPSGQFAADPRHRATTATLPSYEAFTHACPGSPQSASAHHGFWRGYGCERGCAEDVGGFACAGSRAGAWEED